MPHSSCGIHFVYDLRRRQTEMCRLHGLFVICCLPEGKHIIVVTGVARNVFFYLEEWREAHIIVMLYAACLQDGQPFDGREVGVEFKILPFPDEGMALFLDGLPVRVCLLQHGTVDVVRLRLLSLTSHPGSATR